MERDARKTLKREGFTDKRQRHERTLAVRYKGQSFELDIPWTTDTNIAESFHKAHHARYGYSQTDNIVEIVSARVRSVGIVDEPRAANKKSFVRSGGFAKPHSFALVFFERGRKRCGVYDRGRLNIGARLHTPCIVTEYSATTLIPNVTKASVDGNGNLIIEL
jgi:N-methylhydantoinase A